MNLLIHLQLAKKLVGVNVDKTYSAEQQSTIEEMAETKRWPYSPNKNQQEHDSSSIAVPRYVQQQFSKLDDISEVNAEEFTREDLLDREKREREIRELKKVVNSDEDVYVHMSRKSLFASHSHIV